MLHFEDKSKKEFIIENISYNEKGKIEVLITAKTSTKTETLKKFESVEYNIIVDDNKDKTLLDTIKAALEGI